MTEQEFEELRKDKHFCPQCRPDFVTKFGRDLWCRNRPPPFTEEELRATLNLADEGGGPVSAEVQERIRQDAETAAAFRRKP